MGNRTTNRVESTHSGIKRHNKTSSGSLDLVTRKLREWVEQRAKYRDRQTVRESLFERVVKDGVSKEIDDKMGNLRGRVTSYAFDHIRDELIWMKKNDFLESSHEANSNTASEKCTCISRRAFRLPCRHVLQKQNGPIRLASVHKRWHICYRNGRVATISEIAETNASRRDESENNTSTLLEVQLHQLHSLTKGLKTQQEKVNLSEELNELFEKYKDNVQIDSLLMPTVVHSTKGRPKNTNREKIALERAQDDLKKFQKKEKALQKGAIAKNQATGIPIPKGLTKKQVGGHFNPLPDGNCGFRALSHAILGDQEQCQLLKSKLIAFINDKSAFYRQIWGSSPSSEPSPGTFESILNKLCNETSLSAQENWFHFPEMVQLTADTFGRAIACYTPDQQNITFVPYFSCPSPTRPILLQLHASHFYLIEIKATSRPRWSPTFPGHSIICINNLLQDYTLIYTP
ncbi:hypothetical protein FB192DRAFT_1444936 [Mucor lusitanicus]|uniref:SWIM-type domain-containing protein n=2 Tax=Mucor circinelloides f. lusitanicus TaxID=29924 RepID=A0A168QD38_MUCCL|nr:hypothetical protein FB192DRAFT_1444936 [Mucor lusitanicus]OAD09078.1 hypothetical protein MUCCIDRAFT_106051 [Mucor lusitanicus CBS 277.49]